MAVVKIFVFDLEIYFRPDQVYIFQNLVGLVITNQTHRSGINGAPMDSEIFQASRKNEKEKGKGINTQK